jgi:hypothetical protein
MACWKVSFGKFSYTIAVIIPQLIAVILLYTRARTFEVVVILMLFPLGA